MGTVARLTSAGMDLARRIGVPDDETMSRCQLLPVSSTQRRPRLVDPENPRMWARAGASAARRRERSRPWRSRWRTRSAQEPQRLADLPHCWMPNAPDLVADVLPRFGQTRQDYRSRPEVSASVDKRHRRRDGDSTCSTTREPRRRVGLLSDLRTTCGSSRASSGSSSTVRSPRARRAGRSQLGSPRSSIRLAGGVPYSGQTSTAGSMSTQAENEQATKQPADRSSTEWRASGRTASGATANTVDLPLATRSA